MENSARFGKLLWYSLRQLRVLGLYWGYVGIMETKMETTRMDYFGFRVIVLCLMRGPSPLGNLHKPGFCSNPDAAQVAFGGWVPGLPDNSEAQSPHPKP